MEINRDNLEKLFNEVQCLQCQVKTLEAGTGGGGTDIFVDGGNFNAATTVLTLTDNSGGTPDVVIDLSTLAGNTSVITGTSAGNLIATHNDGTGTLVNINETITTLTENATTKVLTYTSENGTVINFTGANIYVVDGTLTDNRTLTGGGNSLTETGLSAKTVNTTGDINMTSSAGGVNLTANGNGVVLSDAAEGSTLTVLDEIIGDSSVSTSFTTGATFDVNAAGTINLNTTTGNGATAAGANIRLNTGTAGTALFGENSSLAPTGNKALVDMQSTTKGLLMPRMTTVQRVAIVPAATDEGLRVYDTDTDSFWFWDGTQWVEGSGGSNGYSETFDGSLETLGIPLTITHNLNSLGIIVQMWDETTGEVFDADFDTRTLNTVDATFNGILPTGNVTINILSTT